GPASIIWDPGGNASNGCNTVGTYRAGHVLDTPILNVNCEVGDHHPGAMATMGKISFASSGDDLFYSDLILIWGGNPTYTQIPNAHFINEARYHGATVVCIAPDYSASAIHADLWLPVEVGTDAALGLSMAHVIVEEEIYDADFIREQTDLPLLVRTDTQRFVRQADLKQGGADDIFYFYFHDAATGELREASKRSLSLDGTKPALEGRYKVKTLDGEVEVQPVFESLREQLADYTPEATEAITGTAAKQVRALARHMARAGTDPCLRVVRPVRQEGQRRKWLPRNEPGRHGDRDHLTGLALAPSRGPGRCGSHGAGLRQSQAPRRHRRDVHLRGDPRGIPQGWLPSGCPFLHGSRRPRGFVRGSRSLGPSSETALLRVSEGGGGKRLASAAVIGETAHLLRGRRQHLTPHPRLRPPVRKSAREARPPRHARLAHEQHCALREERHHLGHTHRPFRPPHHARRRAPRGVEERLGVPLRSSGGDSEARQRTWPLDFQRSLRKDPTARQGLRRAHFRRALS
ncbi:MAG: molybdopterin-dependent oxidoreductase, partial [Deltaproteobacteria bacterium]|nr:molybdopterin-dependent oxidoreductase [Deltaproteobacteria bacterium]